MERLGIKNKTLLIMGAKIEGNFVGAYQFSEEEFYCDEADEILAFCKWIDNEVGGASQYNIETLFDAWKNPTDYKMKFVNELKEKIRKIKSF